MCMVNKIYGQEVLSRIGKIVSWAMPQRGLLFLTLQWVLLLVVAGEVLRTRRSFWRTSVACVMIRV